MLPWFIEELGLSAAADVRSIRQAYAARVKQIDQATQADAFIRLRNAYELALAWRQSTAPATVAAGSADSGSTSAGDAPSPAGAPMREARVHGQAAPMPDLAPAQQTPGVAAKAAAGLPAASPAPSAEPAALPTPYDEAAAIMRQMQQRLGQGEAPATSLGEAIAALQQTSLAAQPAFEILLIRGLAQQHLGHRLTLFQAAVEQLHWDEVGRLRGLDQAGQWVTATLGQQHAWLNLPASQRAEYAGWLDNSYRDPPPESTIAVWPKVEQLLQVYPNYLLLSHSAAHFRRWKAAYAALPEAVRKRMEMFQDLPSPRAFRRANPSTSSPVAKSLPFGGLIWLLIVLVQHLPGTGPSLSTPPPVRPPPRVATQALALPPPRLSEIPLVNASTTDMHKQCNLLYAYLHEPSWQPPEKAQRAELISSLNQCQLTGQWPVALASDWPWQVLHWSN